ncbi:NDR1/HIN1-like protein 10 [Carica papaya]|uniref:NDR1/HIN1-like protein 10 n=1 Tax=Carica papaya TaxID=3649 RepID=UPI000B8CF20A|nr:NDR1/HIN1-like protein 10 [Carica papaya]
MADKQPGLNGAYYGPPIPPPKTYHSHGRGSGCGCGCCCLFTLLIKIVVSIVFLLGLAALIVWLIFRPINKVKFHVTDVSLTQFNLTNSNTIHYDLALNISVRNPNKKIAVHYDRIEARAFYEDARLKVVSLTPFFQGHKNTTVLTPVFKGQQAVFFDAEKLQEFNQETNAGVFSIDVNLHLRVRLRLGKIRIGTFKPRVKCDLKVPASSSNGVFRTTRCDVDFW